MPLDQPSRQSASVEERLPYARHWLTEQDIAAVAAVLRGDWLTTGPVVEQFEQEFARAVDAVEAVAVSSGTAALHAAMHALALGPGDEVIVPTWTFAATANCVRYVGAGDALRDELKTQVQSKIGPWKYPRWIEIVEALPKTATGKIERYKLREKAP